MIQPEFFFDNVLARGELSAGSTDDDFDVLNVKDFRTYSRWRPLGPDGAYIVADCGSAQPANSLFVAGHNLATVASSVEVLTSASGNWLVDGVPVLEYTPGSNRAFSQVFDAVSSRYWVFRCLGETGEELLPELGIVMIGERFIMPRGLTYGFDPLGREAKGTLNTSVEGEPLGTIIDFEQFKETLQFNLTPLEFIRGDFMDAWRTHLRHKPFGFCPDPENYRDECFVVRTDGGFKAPPRTPVLADLSFDVMGKFDV